MASVLIVDDSNVMKLSLRSMLTQAGYTVAGEASDGAEAVRMYEGLKPDLVTMDMNMPNLNGIDAVKAILSKHPEARIVMISTVDDKDRVIEAIKAGAKSYVLKPVTYDKVLDALEKVAK